MTSRSVGAVISDGQFSGSAEVARVPGGAHRDPMAIITIDTNRRDNDDYREIQRDESTLPLHSPSVRSSLCRCRAGDDAITGCCVNERVRYSRVLKRTRRRAPWLSTSALLQTAAALDYKRRRARTDEDKLLSVFVCCQSLNAVFIINFFFFEN